MSRVWVSKRADSCVLDPGQAVAAEDEAVWRVMYAVLFAMMDQPSAFFAPGIVLKVLLWRARNLLGRESERSAEAVSS